MKKKENKKWPCPVEEAMFVITWFATNPGKKVCPHSDLTKEKAERYLHGDD